MQHLRLTEICHLSFYNNIVISHAKMHYAKYLLWFFLLLLQLRMKNLPDSLLSWVTEEVERSVKHPSLNFTNVPSCIFLNWESNVYVIHQTREGVFHQISKY